jgi:hypothetical protein
MNALRAKFAVRSVTRTQGALELNMAPVVGVAGDENHTWSKYTPSGELRMVITNPGVGEDIAPGAEFYLDLTPATAVS